MTPNVPRGILRFVNTPSHARTPQQLYELAQRFVEAREAGRSIADLQHEYLDREGRYISSTTVTALVKAWRIFEGTEPGLLLTALQDLGYTRLVLLLKLREPVATYREGHLAGQSTSIREIPVQELRRWIADHGKAVRAIHAVKKRSLDAAKAAGVPIEGTVELVVVTTDKESFRCRSPVGRELVTVTPRQRGHHPVPGEIVTVRVLSHLAERGRSHILAEVLSWRVDVGALGLVPLALKPQGDWLPREHYWGDRIDPCFQPIIAFGPRPEFEMQQVIPGGESPADPDYISYAMDRHKARDTDTAKMVLMRLLSQDLRCLDAFAHLGLIHFNSTTFALAVRYYEMGVRVGELSLGAGFSGVLPWGHIDNRPFLRCLHGYGLCLWRDDQYEAAAGVFERMLWLNPWDNLGVRFIIEKVRQRRPWKA